MFTFEVTLQRTLEVVQSARVSVHAMCMASALAQAPQIDLEWEEVKSSQTGGPYVTHAERVS